MEELKRVVDFIKDRGTDEELRAQALYFSARHNKIVVQDLRDIYDLAEGTALKEQIYHALTRMRNQDAALDMLIELVRIEKDPELRKTAIFWIGRFDNDRAVEFLYEIIADE